MSDTTPIKKALAGTGEVKIRSINLDLHFGRMEIIHNPRNATGAKYPADPSADREIKLDEAEAIPVDGSKISTLADLIVQLQVAISTDEGYDAEVDNLEQTVFDNFTAFIPDVPCPECGNGVRRDLMDEHVCPDWECPDCGATMKQALKDDHVCPPKTDPEPNPTPPEPDI